MSFFDSAKDFFGLGPVDNAEDDAYYDDPQYATGSTAYDRSARPERAERTERPTRMDRPAARDYGRDAVRSSYRSTPHIVTAAPRNYNDAKEIGEPFRDGDAVVMDLTLSLIHI